MFSEKYGYFSEKEAINAEEQENIYATLKTAGIEVIECLFL